jgi:hypothetical protein
LLLLVLYLNPDKVFLQPFLGEICVVALLPMPGVLVPDGADTCRRFYHSRKFLIRNRIN